MPTDALTELEKEIESAVAKSDSQTLLTDTFEPSGDHVLVIKYVSPKYLDGILKVGKLHAAEGWYTWGDALYVTPIRYPRSTMMYGPVGVAGRFDTTGKRFFDGTDPLAVKLYQRWIQYQSHEFELLTTTVHANEANRRLRNAFRTRFQIDCVYFHPDEPCPHYSDPASDLWFAVTHWNSADPPQVGSGDSEAIGGLRWCAIGCDGFDKHGLGFRSHLHTGLTSGRMFTAAGYSNLENDLRSAYHSGSQVVIGSF